MVIVDDLKPLMVNQPLIITIGTTTAVGQVTNKK